MSEKSSSPQYSARSYIIVHEHSPRVCTLVLFISKVVVVFLSTIMSVHENHDSN